MNTEYLTIFSINQEEKIKQLLAKQEEGRRKDILLMNAVFYVFISLAIICLLALLISLKKEPPVVFPFLFILFTFLAFFLRRIVEKGYSNKFKRQFLNNMLSQLLPGVKYLQNKILDPKIIYEAELFESKGLYVKPINKIIAEDLFFGTRGKTSFSFSEIKLLNVFNRNKKTVLLKGLFFKCSLFEDINLNIQGKENSLRIRKIEKHSLEKLTLKNNRAFNKYFEILKPINKNINYLKIEAFIDRLEDIRKIFGNELYISFKGRFVYFAIGTNKDYFDPDVSKKLDINQIKSIYYDIINCLMIVDIIDELNHGAPNPNLKQIDEL